MANSLVGSSQGIRNQSTKPPTPRTDEEALSSIVSFHQHNMSFTQLFFQVANSRDISRTFDEEGGGSWGKYLPNKWISNPRLGFKSVSSTSPHPQEKQTHQDYPTPKSSHQGPDFRCPNTPLNFLDVLQFPAKGNGCKCEINDSARMKAFQIRWAQNFSS